jgi:endonuclease YncB( thermonuclease family)
LQEVNVTSTLVFPPRKGSYTILPLEAIDGDTIRFAWLISDHARLYGINAPELHGPSSVDGEKAKKALSDLLPDRPCLVQLFGRDKYGRALMEIRNDQGVSLADILLEKGLVIPYGKKI